MPGQGKQIRYVFTEVKGCTTLQCECQEELACIQRCKRMNVLEHSDHFSHPTSIRVLRAWLGLVPNKGDDVSWLQGLKMGILK